MMYKTLFLSLFLFAGSVFANTVVIVDIAQGIDKKEFKELLKLTYPSKHDEQNIYAHKEKVYLYGFNQEGSLSSSFIYYDRTRKENGYKKASRSYKKFFQKIKKHGIKKTKKVAQNIIFLVDTSGSMKKNDVIEDVKESMRYFVQNKSKKSKVAIVTFDGKAKQPEPKRSKILKSFTRSKKSLFEAIDTIHPSRYDTYLGAGLVKVQKLLGQSNPKKTLILLFTDGKEINDAKKALSIIKRFKDNGVHLKVVAVGGANVDVLEQFSTTGYVYDATSSDLREMIHAMSVANDEIFYRLSDFFENKYQPKKDDRIIIYSSMMNVDDKSDFFVVPNLADKSFYKEIQEGNAQRGLRFDFGGAKVYVRLTGKEDSAKRQQLKKFYKRFFKDANAQLEYFSPMKLSQEDVE